MKVAVKNAYLFLFIIYNAMYVLYMQRWMNRTIYMISLGAFFLFEIYILIDSNKFSRNKKMFFKKELFATMFVAAVFLVISVFVQIRNGLFRFYLFQELLYFIVPCLTAYICINYCDKKTIMLIFYIILAKLVVLFFLKYGSKLSLLSIISINFDDSESSIFESGYAHDFLFLMIIFIYFDEIIPVLVSFVLCILSFKRLPFVVSFILLVFYLLNKSGNIVGLNKIINSLKKWFDGKFSKSTVLLLLFITLLLPFVMEWIYSADGVRWFWDVFGIDLNHYTSGRVNIVNYALTYCSPNGLGSTTDFFKNSQVGNYSKVGNMHCDVMRLKLEVTMVGYALYSFVLFRVFNKNRLTMLLLIYLIIEMTVSHMADNLNVWIIFYVFLAYVTKEKETSVGITLEQEK